MRHQPLVRSSRRLGVFMLEQVMPGLTAGEADAVGRALGDAIRRVILEGEAIRCFRSAHVPSQDRWICLFVASSADPLRRVAALAGLATPRISQVPVSGPAGRVAGARAAERWAA